METRLNTIHDLLDGLNKSYRQTGELLENQINAVVQNQLESLLDAMEELITHQENTDELEAQLRTQVEALAGELNADTSTSLGRLLPLISADTSQLSNMRSQLITNIEKARSYHQQLMQLLQFAQDHTNETLRSIHVLANHHDLRYNQSGKTASTRNKTFAVNQTA